jgi:hypothetical protein
LKVTRAQPLKAPLFSIQSIEATLHP